MGIVPAQTWWAFRSTCTPAGCVATGTKLDNTNHTIVAPLDPTHLRATAPRFVDGHWLSMSSPVQQPCDENGVPSGRSATALSTLALQPRPDGAFDGTATANCGALCCDPGW